MCKITTLSFHVLPEKKLVAVKKAFCRKNSEIGHLEKNSYSQSCHLV
jgi:hypothetical protein